MENGVKVINKVGKDLSVKVDNSNGIIEVTVEYPENRLKLSYLKPGDIFKADDMEYIVLEHLGNGTAAVMRKEPLSENMVFDFEDNNWKLCRIRRFLNSEYLEELKEVFGECNIVCHVTDLASLDGLKDYGKCTDKVSLLGIVQYWQYREYLGGYCTSRMIHGGLQHLILQIQVLVHVMCCMLVLWGI